MKNLIMASFVFMSLNCYSQIGIRAGLSTSWFNAGDQTYSGINHNYQSITAGFFYKMPHVQIELIYLQGGAKNPREDNRTFKTYNIQLPVTLKANIGDVNLQVGGYISRLVGASNYNLFTRGPNFGWSVKAWKWYARTDYGLVAGVGINLHPIFLEGHYRQGLRNVRQYDYDYNGVYDPSYQGCHNASADIAIYIPFNLNKK